MTTRVDAGGLARAVDRVRSNRTASLKSNYFFGRLRAQEFPLWETDQSLVFLDREHDFQRVYFLSSELTDLSNLLHAIPQRPLVADYVTQSDDEAEVNSAMAAAGFRKAALYRRMSNNNLAARTAKAGSSIQRAREDEAEGLFEQLCQHFNVRLDRIPRRDEFVELVRRGQVLVHRQGEEIDGYNIYQLLGRRAHWNYWYIRPGTHRAVAFKLIEDMYSEMRDKGINAAFLWVEQHNLGVIEVHKRLGFEFDGLVTHVYVKE